MDPQVDLAGATDLALVTRVMWSWSVTFRSSSSQLQPHPGSSSTVQTRSWTAPDPICRRCRGIVRGQLGYIPPEPANGWFTRQNNHLYAQAGRSSVGGSTNRMTSRPS